MIVVCNLIRRLRVFPSMNCVLSTTTRLHLGILVAWILAGQATAAVAFAAWMASAPHRANNLLVDAEHVGVGYAENPDTQYRSYWVVVFGRSYEAPFTPPGGCHP